MTFEYRNRRGDVYLLQSGTTATGKPRYYFGRKISGTPVDEIPEGYETYESPERAQVYLRKAVPSAIASIEREIVVDGIRRLADLDHFIVELERDSLVVYTPGVQPSEANECVQKLGGPQLIQSPRLRDARDWLVRRSNYHKMLRFQLEEEEEKRLFRAYRWCFRGSIDDWICLTGLGELSDLIESLAEHLGSESFFELI